MKNKEETIFRAVEPGETLKGFHITLTDLNDGKALIDEDCKGVVGCLLVRGEKDEGFCIKNVGAIQNASKQEFWQILESVSDLALNLSEMTILKSRKKNEAEEKQTSEKESEAQSN